MLLVCMLLNINVCSAQAANEYYYKGFDITYKNGEGIHVYDTTWRGGFLWLTNYKEEYYITNSYMRCLTYYHSSWVANQGQTLTISASKTVSRSVSEGVSAELGVSDVASVKLGTEYTTSVSTSYSTSLGLTYDLSKFSHRSYKIASMGYYDKFNVYNYKNGKYVDTKTVYAYDAKYGQEIRLVYRY
ncbi:MAG: hypothetical protein ACI4EU_07260 [Butyrivibrio sp.]